MIGMEKSLQRLGALIRKETIQLLRDRRLIAFILGLPLLELFLYGYAAQLTVYHLPLAVADQSGDEQSRQFVQALVNSQYFDLTMEVDSQAAAIQAIDQGKVKAGLVIPPNFGADLDAGTANVLIVLDGSDSSAVQSGYTAAGLVAQDYALQLVARQVSGGGLASGLSDVTSSLPIVTSTRVLYNPDLIDIWFILPGLVGLLLQTLAITQAALIVVRERELGTIEQMLITPSRPLEVMVSKIIPLLALCLVALGVVVGIGVLWFGVPFQGNPFLYLWLSLLFIASSLGLGLLLSARSKTQMEATQYGALFMLVGILMSGFMYPLEAMPASLRLVGSLFPVTYFIRISRSIFTKGVGLSFVWSDALILAIYGAVVVVMAARSFKPRLD
jgi:ABC-2 type transport system permease protein